MAAEQRRQLRVLRDEQGIRMVEFGHTYLRLRPSFGVGVPFRRGLRLRFARHHGLQLVRWNGHRYVVAKQLAGRSTVRGEVFDRR